MARVLHLLVPDSELARWREEADDLGLSLTTLIRARMNGERSSDSRPLDEAALDAVRQVARDQLLQARFR